MNNKLNDRSRAVLDALREGRHAPVLPSPAPETRPCVICESTLTSERVRRYPRALTCSADCSIEHQVRLNRVIGREGQRRRRAQRKQTADAGRGIGGEAGPTDRSTDGLGRSLSVDSSGQGRVRTPPRRENAATGRSARQGFSPSTAKMGVSARSGQKPDIDLAAAALPSASTPSDLHPLHHLHQGRRACKLLTTRRVRFSIEDLVLPELRPRLEYRERGRQGVPRIVQLERDLLAVEDVSDGDGEA